VIASGQLVRLREKRLDDARHIAGRLETVGAMAAKQRVTVVAGKTATADFHLMRLREKLGKDIITTRRGQGYVFGQLK